MGEQSQDRGELKEALAWAQNLRKYQNNHDQDKSYLSQDECKNILDKISKL